MGMRAKVMSNPKTSAFQRRITQALERTDKTQLQIALEMGYDKSNIITMFKQGLTRVPLEKIPAFAEATDQDAAELVRMWMEEFIPESWAVVQAHAGFATSKREREWVRLLRRVFKETGMPPADEAAEQRLREMIAPAD